MDGWLRQSTAVTLKIGPFVDSTDGNTAETALTISQADVRLSKNGADIAQKTEATSCTHDELGMYDCPVDATDTGTLGRLDLVVAETGALVVRHTYMVVPANVWDSLFGAGALQVDVAQWLGTAVATPTTVGVPEVDVTHVAGSATTATLDTIKTDTAAILVDTGTTLDGRIPAALVGGRMDSNLGAISGSTNGVAALQRSADAIVRCTVGAASTTTNIVTSACAPSGAVADQFKGRIVIFDANTTTTALRGQATDITASSNAATPELTVTALTTAPVSGDTFVIV